MTEKSTLGFECVAEDPKLIKVIGVGGAGGNAINHMIQSGVNGVEFIAANTDSQALERSLASIKIPLGTTGLGAGARPEQGRMAAEQAREKIREALSGAQMVFITAGMGGGTGTGAAPVVAQVSKELGILTVGIVTKPFSFEGRKRMSIAEEGIEELNKHVHSIIVVLNEKLFEVMDPDSTAEDCFKEADNVLRNACAGIAEIINVNGQINVDFEDVKTVMAEQGQAMLGTATASGEDRARIAAEGAIACPLLEGVNLKGARGILLNVTSSSKLKISELRLINEIIGKHADPDAMIISGTAVEEDLGDAIRVTVVATGLEGPNAHKEDEPSISIKGRTGLPRIFGASDNQQVDTAGLLQQQDSPSGAGGHRGFSGFFRRASQEDTRDKNIPAYLRRSRQGAY